MKRKFGFSLAPLKIPSKTDAKASKTSTRGGDLLSPVSPPPSPFINRQRIDPLLVAQLRASCAAVVSGCPDEHEPEPQLNFKPLGHAKSSHSLGLGPENVRPLADARMSTTDLARQREGARNSRVPASKSTADLKHAQQRPVGEAQKAQRASMDQQRRSRREASMLNLGSPGAPSIDPARRHTALPLPPPPQDSDGSNSTSRTGSTGGHADSQSTSATSAAYTPARFIQKTANSLACEDAQLQRLVQKWDEQAATGATQRQRPVSHQAPKRVVITESRAWAQPTANGLHKRSASATVELKAFGGRGRSSADTKGTHFDSYLASKSIADLNRDLPPLPPISSWVDHVASDCAEPPAHEHAAPRPRNSARVDSANPIYQPEYSASDRDSRTSHSLANSASTRPSLLIPNFSRKISIDVNGGIRTDMFGGGMAPAPPPTKPSKSSKGLRRILSKLEIGRSARERPVAAGAAWMSHFEQRGIHSGFLQERREGAAVVRF